jgi:hypothetical protein
MNLMSRNILIASKMRNEMEVARQRQETFDKALQSMVWAGEKLPAEEEGAPVSPEVEQEQQATQETIRETLDNFYDAPVEDIIDSMRRADAAGYDLPGEIKKLEKLAEMDAARKGVESQQPISPTASAEPAMPEAAVVPASTASATTTQVSQSAARGIAKEYDRITGRHQTSMDVIAHLYSTDPGAAAALQRQRVDRYNRDVDEIMAPVYKEAYPSMPDAIAKGPREQREQWIDNLQAATHLVDREATDSEGNRISMKASLHEITGDMQLHPDTAKRLDPDKLYTFTQSTGVPGVNRDVTAVGRLKADGSMELRHVIGDVITAEPYKAVIGPDGKAAFANDEMIAMSQFGDAPLTPIPSGMAIRFGTDAEGNSYAELLQGEATARGFGGAEGSALANRQGNWKMAHSDAKVFMLDTKGIREKTETGTPTALVGQLVRGLGKFSAQARQLVGAFPEVVPGEFSPEYWGGFGEAVANSAELQSDYINAATMLARFRKSGGIGKRSVTLTPANVKDALNQLRAGAADPAQIRATFDSVAGHMANWLEVHADELGMEFDREAFLSMSETDVRDRPKGFRIVESGDGFKVLFPGDKGFE